MPRPDRLRVVFTGHAGLLKGAVSQRFCGCVSELANIDPTLVRCYDAEEILKPMERFLPLDWRKQQLDWLESLGEAIARCEEENPAYAFLSLHLSYRWYSRFFSPISWRVPVRRRLRMEPEDSLLYLIGQVFRPDYCVCLIDDIQAAQHRIATAPTEIHLRLGELLSWRNVETLFTDLLAKETILKPSGEPDSHHFPFERSPVVPIRHPPEMLYRFLFEPERLRIYASYPMTRTRPQKHLLEEINRFRSNLNEQFTVFDPATIDELPLVGLREAEDPLGLPAEARWPIPGEHTLCGEDPREISNLSRDEILEITQTVAGQNRPELARAVEERDFRFIDQADCVVVYRPQFSTDQPPATRHTPSGGTAAEIDYALVRVGRPVFIIHDPEVDGDFQRGVFDPDLPGAAASLLDEIGNLSDPRNQERVLDELTHRLLARQDEFVRTRLRQ